MSEILTKTIRALHKLGSITGKFPDEYFVSESDWHSIKDELELQQGKKPNPYSLILDEYFLLYGVKIYPVSEDEPENELVRDDGQFGVGA